MTIKLVKITFIVLLPLLILLGTVNFIASDMDTYMKGYDKYNITEVTGISRDDLGLIADKFIGYMVKGEEDLQLKVKVHGKERDVFNEKELLHMVDVQNLVKLSQWVLGGIVIGLLSLSWYVFRKKGILEVVKTYMVAAITSLIAIPALYVLLPKDFNSLFTLFHEVLFTNDLWLLDERTDILLQMHPLGFFMDIGINIGITFVVINIIISLIGGMALFLNKRMKAKA